jgi:hypothetical protein
MIFLDAILNLAALLLWIGWRAVEAAPSNIPRPGESLVALLQPAGRKRSRPHYLLFLAGLLVLRALFFWQIGAPLHWTPTLTLGAIVVSFRSDYLGLMFLHTGLSFLRFVLLYYVGLLLFSLVNRRVNDSDVCQRWIRGQLGWLERLPAWARVILPPVVIAVGWVPLQAALETLFLIPRAVSVMQVVEQGMVIGLASFLVWQALLVVLFVLHLLNSYIYFGELPLWNFVTLTSHNVLRWFAWLPLQVRRIDFAPVVAIAVVIALGWAWWRGLTWLFVRLPL